MRTSFVFRIPSSSIEIEGLADGFVVGMVEGLEVGEVEGLEVGEVEGIEVGDVVGLEEGDELGELDGDDEGEVVGLFVQSGSQQPPSTCQTAAQTLLSQVQGSISPAQEQLPQPHVRIPCWFPPSGQQGNPHTNRKTSLQHENLR